MWFVRAPAVGGDCQRGSCCWRLRRLDMATSSTKQPVVCVSNTGYPASLENRKIYVALRDDLAEELGLLRIVDASGDDYLYPKAFFRMVALPRSVKRAVLAAA